ncbi:hypothetical protein [Bordetella pseudohinzii]|uniref:Uncharacterized protein n=1 Tax=Bordetella pseudohinzii TaxID=1331258 RepID=A0A0J6BZZ0_9BORD|nr:hypothetical protein [Bordetella pseudohinzii]ANY18492.1 hypothetical protein BBN53_20935 [Bordetella pseudohinzii]KMM24106.1 hypothetical protein L540_08245 [Bordetella pseudohinzii]KXA77826.1 hypothetical protein AW878_14110 [Bordetella pseudohinzii]KXA78022.1 hypothetical protein AW877_12570 [Bordetella pseudohinzii]CUJ13021.1 Uncharacterised protein [Bordetella pseudohinzii]
MSEPSQPVETAFEKLLGRQPSASEREQLFRVKDALDLKDNDALWMILIVLQSYDALYRRVPARIEAAAEEMLAKHRSLMGEQAQLEVKRAMGGLAQAVGAASTKVAIQAARTSRFLAWGWILSTVVLFAALCLWVGAVAATGQLPPWAPAGQQRGLVLAMLGGLAHAPAGWIVALGATAGAVGAVWANARQMAVGKARLNLALVAGAGGLLLVAGAMLATLLA